MGHFEHKVKNRREFLRLMGRTGVGLAAWPALSGLSSGCWWKPKSTKLFEPLKPMTADELVFAAGFQFDRLLTEGQPINAQGALFGSNNDFLAIIPIDPKNPNDCLLWVNHEMISPTMIYKKPTFDLRAPATYADERKWVGGSIVRVKKEASGTWHFVAGDPLNRRIDGATRLPFSGGHKILGREFAEGTLANCAGGLTPWRTFLTCEENFQSFYGYSKRDKYYSPRAGSLKWNEVFKNPPEHYGWVVEIDPFTGEGKKLVGLGRFAHESATVATLPDGRAVVYSGDDHDDECIYKFIASKPGSLEEGTLYVADTEKGRWIPMVWENNAILKKHFANQLEVFTYARNAAELVGGTPQDRPEGIAIDPKTKAVIVALSNNKPRGRHWGSLLQIHEKDGNHESLEFTAKTLISGGLKSGFACPDNLAFDHRGNLWFTSDIADETINKGPYEGLGHNGLYYLPLEGREAGRVYQVASAPVEAELTGICFSPDGQSMFLCVQHPGGQSYKVGHFTGRWPHEADGLPKSAVVVIDGPTMKKLLGSDVLLASNEA